uniref:Uncharacterized protein n=1 Tax=Rhizophora mucronata TaxID=61149 RepID=A0A2P2R0E1_RHIMU
MVKSYQQRNYKGKIWDPL